MKIKFSVFVPHIVAIVVFLVVTLAFFSPVFFESKALNQHDIQQYVGSSKALHDYRAATGEEGLWAESMFSGMPAYLVNLQWSDGVVVGLKKLMSLFLPHPVCNIFLAFVCYYILLLTFRIRPFLAMAGAIAFGLSSFMIIGLGAGHNARIGAIAFMPLVVAGIHLAFNGKRILGFGVTAAGLALHLRENHLQMTYYLMMIVGVYGLMQLVFAIREKQLKDFFKNIGVLVPAAVIAAGTFFGPFWAITEYSRYSIRGPSELTKPGSGSDANGLSKAYAFEYSNGIIEPMTLMIPNYLGGASSSYFVQDENSETYKALVASGNNELANQLARYSSSYWGPQSNTAPYYEGVLIVFLFVIGILFAEKKYVWWLIPLSVLSIMLSWGDSFSTFNYALFDYFPGYNKFRSVTFALVIILFAMPLLGLLGLERVLSVGWNKSSEKKLVIALVLIPVLCLLLAFTGGFNSFLRPQDIQLPAWFRSALSKDRLSLFRADAWRAFWFTLIFAAVLFAVLKKWIKENYAVAALLVLTLLDVSLIDRRYFGKDNYQRKRENKAEASMTDADKQIALDKGHYRVFNLDNTMGEALTSYFHNSVGGYHGAKMRRYLDVYDSVMEPQMMKVVQGLQSASDEPDFKSAGGLNMLNVKYVMHSSRRGFFENKLAYGPAWFVGKTEVVNSPNDELKKTGEVDTRNVAVIDGSKFKLTTPVDLVDSSAKITLLEAKLPYLKYESQSASAGLAVFSEIYYPKGWHARIDGKEVPLLRVDYVLRAVEVPAGKHTIEFSFEPKPYLIGNKVTMITSWLLLVLLAGSLGFTWGLTGISSKE